MNCWTSTKSAQISVRKIIFLLITAIVIINTIKYKMQYTTVLLTQTTSMNLKMPLTLHNLLKKLESPIHNKTNKILIK